MRLADLVATSRTVAASSGRLQKIDLLATLLRRVPPDEIDIAGRRAGVSRGAVLLEAVGRASGVPAIRIRRAAMLAGALAPVARAALVDGQAGVSALVIRSFQPMQPMLAESAAGIGEALADLGQASLEHKLDGARIQVHKSGGEVRVFSRSLRDVAAAVPEVVEAVHGLAAGEIVLDGEAIALKADRSPLPFQVTMRRFVRRLDVERLRADIPIFPFFFDCLSSTGTCSSTSRSPAG